MATDIEKLLENTALDRSIYFLARKYIGKYIGLYISSTEIFFFCLSSMTFTLVIMFSS